MNFSDLISRYSVKHDKQIKKICEPLMTFLGIPYCSYYTIRPDGTFTILGNFTEQLDYFFSEKLYIGHDYHRHPKFFSTGYKVDQLTANPNHLTEIEKRFLVKSSFISLTKLGGSVHGFLFGTRISDMADTSIYINNLMLLKKFSNHFIRETKSLMTKMTYEGYNLQHFNKDSFLLPPNHVNDPSANFLKALQPNALSKREQECLDLFQNGYSAQASAAILGLSQRTVETYFENIKNKLGCSSKWDLLNY